MSTTFERIDLDQYDGITPGEWVVGRPNTGPVSGTTPVITPGYDHDGYRDGALVCSVYGTAARSARNARAIADVPRLLAALKAAYAENDRLRASIAADARNRCERCGVKIVDHTLVCGAPQCCPACCREATLEAEIAEWEDKSRKMQAEIDRLSANALEWHVVTEDPATLPRPEETVIVRQLDGTAPWPTCRVPDREEWDEMWLEGEDGGLLILPGDRWAYVPEVQS